ncbi:MAG: hypothetical protein [Caudoviricetes sp.]|nr:MAG: hypothetical protein [Caudoviricetes sp.]
MGMVNSTGFGGLVSSGLARVAFSKYIIAKGTERDFLSDIVNNEWDQDVLDCMQVVQFSVKPYVGEWRDYNDTQQMIADEPTPSFIKLQICRAAYKAIAISELDKVQLCDRFTMFESAFVDALWEGLATLCRKYAIGGMYGAAEHHGKHAGLGLDVNLGASGDAITVTSENIHHIFSRARRVLAEKYRWSQTPGEMFALISPAVEEMILNSTKFSKVNELGTSGESQILTGQMKGTIMGFSIYVTNNVITSSTGEISLLFGWRQAYIFYMNIIRARIQPQPKSFVDEYQALAIYDGKAIMPDALAVAVIKLNNTLGDD